MVMEDVSNEIDSFPPEEWGIPGSQQYIIEWRKDDQSLQAPKPLPKQQWYALPQTPGAMGGLCYCMAISYRRWSMRTHAYTSTLVELKLLVGEANCVRPDDPDAQ